jgi:hypothetical protein
MGAGEENRTRTISLGSLSHDPRGGHALAGRLRVIVFVWCIWTQATYQCPAPVGLDGMSEGADPIPVEFAVPVHRNTEDALRFFDLPGIRICPARHPEDSLRFLAVT